MAGSPNPRRDKAVDNDGLRYSAMESALRRRCPPPPGRPSRTETSSHFAEAQIHARLTNPAKQNIITSIRGSKRQMADIKSEPPAGFKSESVAGFLLECVAGFVGIRSLQERVANHRMRRGSKGRVVSVTEKAP